MNILMRERVKSHSDSECHPNLMNSSIFPDDLLMQNSIESKKVSRCH